MIMHDAPSRRKRDALPLGELPLFRWAATRSSPADSLAVILLAHRFRLPAPLARTIAENAGFPMEASHA
jgi:hypothetical protein